VSHVGRFESDLIVEAYKTDGKISRTLKKLVNKDEEKVRELHESIRSQIFRLM